MNRRALKKRRLEEDYRKFISEALSKDINDPRLKGKFITITRVEMNSELSIASVFFTVYNDENVNKIIKAFYAAEYYFLNIIRSRVRIKYLPGMRFFYDRKTVEADKVTALIDKLSAEYKIHSGEDQHEEL